MVRDHATASEADEAVKRRTAMIQDPKEFFDWSINSNMKEVKILFVEKTECRKKLEYINRMNLKHVKGTMKLHTVACDSDNAELCIRETSC